MIIELAYDDGGAELFWSDYYPNGIAVMFSPPASRWKITAILIHGFIIDKGEKPFIVELRDRDLNVIFRTSLSVSEYFKNATLHWARIPLPNVTVRGDFYVCVYPMLDFNGTQLWIAIDNGTASDRCFLIDCYRQGLRDWTGASDITFGIPIGVKKVSKLYIIRVNGFEYRISNVAFKILEKDVTVSGPEGQITLQTGYRFMISQEERASLEVDVPYEKNYKLAFIHSISDDGGLVVRPKLKYGGDESWDIVGWEYQETYCLAKGAQVDNVLIIYKDDGTVKLVGLTRHIPSIRSVRNAVAVIHAEDELEQKGYEITGYEDGSRFLADVTTLLENGKVERYL